MRAVRPVVGVARRGELRAGRVEQAHDEHLDRDVAVKRVPVDAERPGDKAGKRAAREYFAALKERTEDRDRPISLQARRAQLAAETGVTVGCSGADLAREGQAVVLEPRPARVDRFALESRPDADTAIFLVESGKGVYMRSLARDIARAVGTVGHSSVRSSAPSCSTTRRPPSRP